MGQPDTEQCDTSDTLTVAATLPVEASAAIPAKDGWSAARVAAALVATISLVA